MRMTAVLEGGPQATEVVREFLADVALWKELKATNPTTRKEKDVLKRHCLQLTHNQQYVKALEELAGVITDDFLKLVRQRSEGVISSQACEDMVGAAKNDVLTKTCRRFRKPETAMHQILQKHVVEKRHDYTPIPRDLHVPEITKALDPCAFRPDDKKMPPSLPFSEVASTSASPPWYSPSATNVNTPFADLPLILAAKEAGNFKLLRDAWVGSIVDVSRRFVFCLRARPDSAPSANDKWYLGLWAYPDSSVVAWPGQVREIPGSTSSYFKLDEAVVDPCLVAVFDLHRMFAREVTWRSWLWQYHAFPMQRASMQVSIKAFLGVEMPVLKLAAEKAFWSMSASEVAEICKHAGVHLESNSGLLDLLGAAVSNLLGCDEARTLEVLSQRLATSEACNEYSEAILEVDAAVQVLDQADHQVMETEKGTASQRIQGRADYQREYVARVRKHRETTGPKAKKAKGPLAQKKMPTVIPQAEARKFIPPGTSIWRGTVRGSWQGHCKPFKRVYVNWKASSEPEAMKEVMRQLWCQYIQREALTNADCPWQGLLGDPVVV